MPDKRYFERIVRDTGFNINELEKTYHLARALQKISQEPYLYNNLTLKGGTVLNFIYSDIPRLSVDLDFNLTGVVQDSRVDSTIKEIFSKIKRLAEELGHKYEESTSTAIWERGTLRYLTLRGPTDFIRIEVDKVERVPLLERIEKNFSHPFKDLGSFSIFTYELRELLAMKIKSLFERGHPRDLFDLYRLSTLGIETERLIDLIIGYACFSFQGFDLPDLIEKARAITEKEFEDEVVPFLRGGQPKRLEEIKRRVIEYLKNLYAQIQPAHRKFLQNFRKGQLSPNLLSPDISRKVINHPSILFWLKHGNKHLTIKD